jgi:hypothetical protein
MALDQGVPWKVALIQRLVNDDRMRRVWSELSERKRDRDYHRTDTFEHQASPRTFAHRELTNAVIQQQAIKDLFSVAILVTEDSKLLPERFLERAVGLREDAARLLRDGRPRKSSAKLAETLIVAAKAYEQANRIQPLSHMRDVRAVFLIATFMEERFGLKMHKLTATLTSVALQRKITPHMVREWVGRNRPAKRRTKRLPLG